MAPKVKITKDEIVLAALSLIRKEGSDSLNTRGIAAAIGCSTQPLFSNFSNMAELEEAVRKAAYELYLGFIKRETEEGKYPQYKAFGMAYIRFATEESELFKFIFMRDRRGMDEEVGPDFTAAVEMISKSNGISREKAELIHLEMWAIVHGIAVMQATSFLSLTPELTSVMLSDVYLGIIANILKEG